MSANITFSTRSDPIEAYTITDNTMTSLHSEFNFFNDDSPESIPVTWLANRIFYTNSLLSSIDYHAYFYLHTDNVVYILTNENSALPSSTYTNFAEYSLGDYNWSGTLPILSNTCFRIGTMLKTDQGLIEIQNITTENTIRNKPVKAITKTLNTDDYLVMFKKNCFYKNCPSEDTVVSNNHEIFYKGKMYKAYKFLCNDNVIKVQNTSEFLYNILLDTHDKIIANNMICETLHPENKIAKLFLSFKIMNEKEKSRAIENFYEEYIQNKLIKA